MTPPSLAKALSTQRCHVIDESSFQRSIVSETLRALGAREIEGMTSAAESMERMRTAPADIILLDWSLTRIDGLEYTQLIRLGETPAKRDCAIIMITARSTAEDVETARRGGVDEYLIKPFNTQSLEIRLREVLFNRRQFVKGDTYVGPCRRRRFVTDYEGPRRRLFDEESDLVESPEAQLKRKLAINRIAEAQKITKEFTPGDRQRIREVYRISRELLSYSSETTDKLFGVAVASLVEYIEGVGASPRFDPEVLTTHLDAMNQLLTMGQLPEDMRERVASALGALVRKKLGRGAT